MQKAVFNIFFVLTVILISVLTIGCTEPLPEENWNTWGDTYFRTFNHIENYKIEYIMWYRHNESSSKTSSWIEIKIGNILRTKYLEHDFGNIDQYTPDSEFDSHSYFYYPQKYYKYAKNRKGEFEIEYLETMEYIGRSVNKYYDPMFESIILVDQEYDIVLNHQFYTKDNILLIRFEATYFSTDIKKFEF